MAGAFHGLFIWLIATTRSALGLPRGTVVLLTVSALCSLCGHTSDSDLAATFKAHRQLFEKLVWMKQADDPRISLVSLENIQSGSSIQLDLARWNEYRDLIRRIRVERLESGGRHGHLRFRVDPPSLLNGARDKGYLYSRDPLPSSRVLATLDRFHPARQDAYSGFEVYKRLDKNWYLYIYLE